MRMIVKVEGMDVLKKEMKAVMEEMKKACGEGTKACADHLAGIVRRNAPRGDRQSAESHSPKKLPDKPYYPAVTMVGLDYGQAPHQHLVEFGTGPRRHASGKSVGTMPASGFFRKSIDEGRRQIVGTMQTHCRKPIEGGWQMIEIAPQDYLVTKETAAVRRIVPAGSIAHGRLPAITYQIISPVAIMI